MHITFHVKVQFVSILLDHFKVLSPAKMTGFHLFIAVHFQVHLSGFGPSADILDLTSYQYLDILSLGLPLCWG